METLTNLVMDTSLNEFQFHDFLLQQIQQDRDNRLPAKKLLEHPFVTFSSFFADYTKLRKFKFVSCSIKHGNVLLRWQKWETALDEPKILSLMALDVHESKEDNIQDWLFKHLINAAKNRETETVKLLCEAGAPVDRRQEEFPQRTALHFASFQGHLSTAE